MDVVTQAPDELESGGLRGGVAGGFVAGRAVQWGSELPVVPDVDLFPKRQRMCLHEQAVRQPRLCVFVCCDDVRL